VCVARKLLERFCSLAQNAEDEVLYFDLRRFSLGSLVLREVDRTPR
jgi:hypothetical protein